MADPILEARDIVKNFGRVLALRGADFSVQPGEVVALVGDNGAGKSTLIKCLAGVEQPDSGEILFEGRPVTLQTPTAARAIGIETVAGPRRKVVVVGGWARDEAVLASKAALGAVETPPVVEAGARGAALLGGVAAGIYESVDTLPSLPIPAAAGRS